ncbi:hypothetical protein F2P56_015181 [Juglans regia]|uniref:UPF0481 protein At3g47200-like n=2 Tax=Juglans regia TaxID=51240 RepID=A0A2I4E484_JUGRE|nr:UPF0481 protein At3g47200-like [Juglans regia]XP_018814207.1 UPF0481 protein At3g47200-like [Juglans regia]KAF5465150.1 hypothetical protein F2P56_015181 [Juglans regia]
MGSNTLSTRIEEKLAISTGVGQFCMYKVHELLRDVNEKAYKPTLLAIGPYHHGKVGQGFMEEHKLYYLQQMLIKTKGSVEAYITALKELEEPARKCYVEYISQTPDQFVEMMLLDGCFIIELFRKYEIYKKTRQKEYDPIFQTEWMLSIIARDLLLFENQLPLFILAKLFGMSESNGSRNLGEHIVDIEETDEISVESSTSTVQIVQTQLNDLVLGFFAAFLPFKWNVNTSNYNSTERIKHLLGLTHEALNPSLPIMICQRLEHGFRFKNAEFEHLLGLIHATICISILDTEIDHAKECQEAEVKIKKAEIFKHLFDLICKAVIPLLAKMKNTRKAISYSNECSGSLDNMVEKLTDLHGPKEVEDWKSIPFGLELLEAQVGFNMANKFKDKLFEFFDWIPIPFGFELKEAGIELNKAKNFEKIYDRNRNEDWKSKQCEIGPRIDGVELNAIQKVKHLFCLNKIENWIWKSIPYNKELREAGVEFHKAMKFKRLHALREIDNWNIHSATELVEAGIKFKKAEKSNLLSLKFNNGLMEISPLSIHGDTETYLRNLIAYEQYRQNGSNYVYNYVRFMDCLINSPKDVELLRRNGIINNCLGDDEIISDMVNKLGHYVIFSTNIYARTSTNLNMHCRRRRNVWMAKLRRDYFNSPWALISFLAAVLLLALAIIQTIFSIIP